MTLADIINAWRIKRFDETRLGMMWIEYTYSGVKRRLTHVFGSSQLWKDGHHGLYRLDDCSDPIPVERNEQWPAQVRLRGSVIIHYMEKTTSSVRAAPHYKHIIHISDIYQDLRRYAAFDATIAAMCRHLKLDNLCVYFHPTVEIGAQPVVVESADSDEVENVSVIESENKNEIECKRNSESDCESLPPLSEESDNYSESNLYESLSQTLRICVGVMNAKFRQIEGANTEDVFERLLELVDKFEDYKATNDVDEKEDQLYYISLAICAVSCAADDYMQQSIADPYLIILLEESQDAYHYYCLSIVAVQLRQFDLAEKFIVTSVNILLAAPNAVIQEDVAFFKTYVEKNKNKQDYKSPVVFYSSENKRLSLKSVADRRSQRLSMRSISSALS